MPKVIVNAWCRNVVYLLAWIIYMVKKNWLFMQDGAPAHTAKTTITYLEKKCNILQNWPANSPDLNPIENLRGIMSRRLNEIDIKTVKNLEKVVREVWKNIDWLMIENLINSMERRLKLVVQLKGDCITVSFTFKAQTSNEI
ncbi:transposable element tc1 transposase [Anaeramoeba flamelloides]|uniref:Transposable element tc1 transposase n=1 Tax=Anaeramoeba flamelloides TaxID=1746091 RepID=A0ABQ8Y2T5_9EUKA|nr:transposable element tc1 transposase [Anaeramoeba flamelloides]